MKAIRLDKYISRAASISRKEARERIRKGLVRIDGIRVTLPETKVLPGESCLELDGDPLTYRQYSYLMMNKPAGVITAVRDQELETVTDWLEERYRKLAPVGRLDRDTEGLLLLTDHGDLAHRLLSPKRHVDKCYLALLDGPVGEEEKEAFWQGLDIGDDKKTMPAVLKTDDKNPARVYITIQEGRFHQVKRMAEAVGRRVLYLKRLSMGSLQLDESLEPGAYRELTGEELSRLLNDAGLQEDRQESL